MHAEHGITLGEFTLKIGSVGPYDIFNLHSGQDLPLDGKIVTRRRIGDSDVSWHQNSIQPPSITIAWPVMYEAAFDARNTIGQAASSAHPILPIGMCRRTSAITLGLPTTDATKAVSINPGQTAFTLIPSAATSLAKTRVYPRIADFVAAYAARSGVPIRPVMDDMLTIAAFWLLRRKGTAWRHISAVPFKFKFNKASQSSGSVSTAGFLTTCPALFTRMSNPPNASMQVATRFLGVSCRVRSASTAFAIPPPDSIAEATSANSAAERLATITCAPRPANAIAVLRPMPRPAPVINAVRPEKSNGFCIS